MNNIKIILLGDSGVGKSRICHHYIYKNKEFPQHSTIGVELNFKLYYTNSIYYKVHLWDTAGQERFRSIIRNYYKNNDSIILVFDINDIETFQNIKLWMEDIKEYSDNKNIYLISNKIDLKYKRHNQIENNIILDFINNNPWIKKYYEVSALTGEHIEETMNDIIEKTILNSTKLYEIKLEEDSNCSINIDTKMIYENQPTNCCYLL